MKVANQKMTTNQDYEARGVVAKFNLMGHYQAGINMKVPIYRFMTLYQGEGREAVPVEFSRPAPIIKEKDEVFLNLAALQEGEFVLHPGLVYKKCLWFPNLMAAHMKALQNYKPKDIIKAEKADDADDAPIDLGTLDATSDQVTKQ